MPGTTQPCGNCGTQTCDATCAFGVCSGEGVCTPATAQPCGNCGVQLCNASCGWDACGGEGVCAPGATQSCPSGGTQSCNTSCQWDACTSNALPLLWFKFDEASGTGTVTNSGSLGNVSQTVTFSQQGVPGMVGLAVQFAAATQGVQIPDTPSLDGFSNLTIESWINYSAFSTSYSTLAKKDLAYICRTVDSTSPKLAQMIVWNSAGQASLNVSITPALNTWYHLACVYEPNVLRIYWNGAEIGSKAIGGGAALVNSSNVLALGRSQTSGENLVGKMDDFKLWSATLSAQQICVEAGGNWNGTACK